MREYNYSAIASIDTNGILFKDMVFIDFEECRYEWAQEHDIPTSETVCVASRLCEDEICYFIFYSRQRVKLVFDISGILHRNKGKKKFQEIQVLLNRYGYTSYDMT